MERGREGQTEGQMEWKERTQGKKKKTTKGLNDKRNAGSLMDDRLMEGR